MRKLFLLIAVLAACLTGCGKMEQTDSQPRYVVLSPEIAEILAEIGAAGNIVGVTEECTYPPELKSIARIGKFGSVNKESVIALKPDVIFTTALEQDALTQELSKLDLRVEQFYPKSLFELLSTIRRIGDITSLEERANSLVDSLSRQIELIRESSKVKTKPRVYIEIYRDPLMSVSDRSFVGELIETAGGDNIFNTLERDYARIDAEDVIAARPDLIICYSQDTLKGILSRKGWQDIPAIRNKRVYFEADLDPDLILRASPRCVLGMLKLQELYAKTVAE